MPANRIVNDRLTEEEAMSYNQLLASQGFDSLANLLRAYVKGPVPKGLVEPLSDLVSQKVVDQVKQLFYGLRPVFTPKANSLVGVLRAGFEPASSAREADMLDRATPPEQGTTADA